MKIKKVSIVGFRSICEESFELEDFTMLLGENNCGKTNTLDAVRFFYGEYKFLTGKDNSKHISDADAKIEITFEFEVGDKDHIYFDNDKCIVRFKINEQKYYIIKDDKEEKPVKSTDIKSGLFGKLIYIESASKIEDHTKLTAKSTLQEIVTNIFSQLLDISPSFAKVKNSFEEFEKNIQTEQTASGFSIENLQSDINESIFDWSTSVNLRIEPPKSEDLIKSMLKLDISDGLSGIEGLTIDRFGQGFQRQFIYSLLCIAPKYKKDKSGNLTLIIYEEPEAFLHPSQQIRLSDSLKRLSEKQSTQVLVSTHSPHFVSQETTTLSGLIRLHKKNGKTLYKHLSEEKLNLILGDLAADSSFLNSAGIHTHVDDMTEEMELIKMFMWFDSERCAAFFCPHVLIVEGPSEKNLFNYIIRESKELNTHSVYIFESLGKYNIHRFMKIFDCYGICHSVLYDKDKKSAKNEAVDKLIENAKSEHTYRIEKFPGDLEDFLGTTRPESRRKPQHLLMQYRSGRIEPERLIELKEKLQNLIPGL